MDLRIIEQIGKNSDKAFFFYLVQEKRFSYLNQSAAQISGLALEEIQNYPNRLAALVHPTDLEVAFSKFNLLLAGERQEHLTLRLQAPQNQLRTIKIDAYPVTDEAGQLFALTGMAEDTSVQTQQEIYLKEFAHKKNSALEIVAHDLQGPMSVMNNIAALMAHDVQEKLYDELSTYTALIQRAYKDSSDLISSVLSDEHLKSPLVLVKKERFNAVEKVRDVMENYRLAPNIDTALHLTPEAGTVAVTLDEVKFMQIINNLISNSIKFTPAQGQIHITVEEINGHCRITHQDNGIGIPAELQPYIFEKHSRASRPGLKGEKSTGIGLSIVKELVEIQGGRIWFESVENQGSTFFLTFPLGN
ncbi:sensor histidine kinase [Rufibacter sp. LB8]|uniref:PAS domain-containing sensor histidine kinase n=1 Tax=Rufibacter sp. LB8 TaxID=2777781 RepID=UPI00178C39F5|nr:sensor histidine kinase [Rufibacter sp. LB8]